jgi:predicted ATPase/DNA-binding SARP family transcriptional activator
VQVLILGSLEVLDAAGAAIALNGPKIRALTALLALDAGKVVSTDRLIDGIYGDDQPVRAANALQLQISKLRHTLRAAGEAAIDTRPPGYVLDIPADDVDALRFARLVSDGRRALTTAPAEASSLLHEALSLWRGPALSDFAFDDFATGERVRLEELRLAAVEDCIEVDLELGRHAECVEQLEQLLAAHPLRERPWGQLMVALYRAGRQAESLRAFARARHLLGEELGIEPGPELRRLEAAVLAQDPSLAGPANTVAAPAPAPRTLDRPLTACIGRERELAEVADLLDAHRLVTLVGPGGTGKTRLGIEAALAAAGRLDGDTLLVDLAPVSDAQGVAAAVRSTLGQSAVIGGGDAAVPAAPALVVLDNCEHVILDAAHAAADLVSTYPGVRVLATSREGLGVPGEVLYAVQPLDQIAAVRLFTERAETASPGTAFDARSSAAVAEICVRLDGLPLAIELAAARTRALDVTQIATRLNSRFQLLTAGPRTLLPRQRTLRAVVDWSYDMLDPCERLLFERLSVFSGAAGLEAIESVCSGGGIDEVDAADLLSRLVDKSLVMVGRGPAGTRYSMLQTLGAYAGERLSESGAAETIRRRHAGWVLDLVHRAERGAGSTPSVSLAELDAEADEVDAAVAWAMANDRTLAFELAARLGWFWFWTGRIDSGWATLRTCLSDPPDVPEHLHARASAWGGMLGTVMQDDGAAVLVEAAVGYARTCGRPGPQAQALVLRGALAVLQGRCVEAGDDLAEAAAGYETAGDRHGQGVVCLVQGMAAAGAGRLAEAEAGFSRSVGHFRAAGEDWAAGVPLQRLAELAERQRDVTGTVLAAEPAFSQALVRAQLASARLGASAATAGGDHTNDLAVAVADHIRGRVALRGDHPEQARPDLELALSRYEAQGNTAAVSTCLCDLGRMALAMGDTTSAVRFHAQATAAATAATDATAVLAALEGLSAALSADGDGERAGSVLGAADLLRDAGLRPWDPAVDDRPAAEAAAVALLGPQRLLQARSQGRATDIAVLLDGLLLPL